MHSTAPSGHVWSTGRAPLRTCCLPTEDIVNEPLGCEARLVLRGSVAAESTEGVIFWQVVSVCCYKNISGVLKLLDMKPSMSFNIV